MGLTISWDASLIKITSPTTQVDAQTLHDFIEDSMASPEGMLYGDILQPEGKIEDPTNPGVYSQIIIVLNSPWQIQFWGGSGYTRIYGGKIVGGLNDEVMKATGTAGDITVLESPVDGLTVATSDVTGVISDIADAVWDEAISDHQIEGTLGETLITILGIAGENVKWSNLAFDANNNMTQATITQYTTSGLLVPRKQWSVTASYNANSELTAYQLVEI